MATRLTRPAFAGLPLPFFGCLAGIVAEKVGLAPIDNYFKLRGPFQPACSSRSFQKPRTHYENLHQSSRALLPVRAGRDIGDVVAMHHQDWHGDLLQVFGEVRLREGDDAVIVRFGTSHHALAPPVPDHPRGGFGTRSVVAIERSRRDIVVETGPGWRRAAPETPRTYPWGALATFTTMRPATRGTAQAGTQRAAEHESITPYPTTPVALDRCRVFLCFLYPVPWARDASAVARWL